MANGGIPKAKEGFFLARKPVKAGGWLYETFPARDKAYYLESGWAETSASVAEQEGKPVDPPVVLPPEPHTILLRPRGRPKSHN